MSVGTALELDERIEDGKLQENVNSTAIDRNVMHHCKHLQRQQHKSVIPVQVYPQVIRVDDDSAPVRSSVDCTGGSRSAGVHTGAL